MIAKRLKTNTMVGICAAAIVSLTFSVGCNQERYQPAKWRTKSKSEFDQELDQWTTLPGNSSGTTLPGTTFPGSTLPNEFQ